MPFTPKETIAGLQHLGRAFARKFRNLPADHYLTLIKKKGYPVSLSETKADVPVSCRLCGSTIARLTLSDGVILDVCPAASMEPFIERIICQTPKPDHILHV